MYILREYQKKAVDAALLHIKSGKGNPVLALSTGAGKSLIIAEIAKQSGFDVLILQPSLEILEQNVEKLSKYVDKKDIGIYSASAGEKTVAKYTFATIGSIHTKPELFAHCKLAILDECHLLSPKDTGTMLTGFLRNLGLKTIGLTATPWRLYTTGRPSENGFGMDTFTAHKVITRLQGGFWSDVICNVTMQDLIDKGFLCAPKYYNNSKYSHKDIPMNKSGSEFDLDKYELLMQGDEDRILDVIARAIPQCKSILVFCISVEQATRFSMIVKDAEVVTGKTKKDERKRIVEDFKNGSLKTVFNVGCFTTGFDHPSLDCIILVRPTRSLGLYVQMVGRGVRCSEGKEHCKVIDFTGTVEAFGRAESVRLVKVGRLWDIWSSTGSWHYKDVSQMHKS